MAVHGIAFGREKDPPNNPSNILGYRYDNNWWELNQPIANIDLRGFQSSWIDPEQVFVVFEDFRPVRFGARDHDAWVYLIFAGDRLVGNLIRIEASEKPYSYFDSYYTKSRRETRLISNEPGFKAWQDSAGDTLLIEDTNGLGCPSDEHVTSILYLQGDAIPYGRHWPLPEWLNNLSAGWGYEGL